MLTRTAFAKRLKEQVLVLDGGTGTLLQEWGLPRGTAPESWNLDRPEAIGDVHRTYIASGADVVLTNTFGATRLKLEAYGLEGRLAAINAAAVRIAKKEAAGKAWVGVSVGPLGKSLYPLGDLTFDQAFELFAEQMKIVRRAKPDLIVLETFADLREARAAALAARDHFEGPILAQMTFSEGDATLTGVKARAAAIALEALDLDAVGANCSLGPEELFPVMEEMAKATDLPLLVQPNAGLPELRSGKTVFPGGPDLFEKWAPRFAAIGVNLLGGCCGTGPEHIRAIRGAVRGIAPLRRRRPEGSRICGRSQAVELGAGRPAALLGERINPTARKSIREAILGGAWHVLRAETEAQAKAGACAVDVNVGAPGADEAEAMRNAVRAVQSAAGLPLCLDSSDPAVLERGLKEVEGKCLLNSTTADEGKVRKLAALARRYGAALVGLTLDEKGIPEDAEGRLRLATRIVKGCEAAGLRREDVFIDPIILSTGTDARQARECLQAIERIKQTLGVPVVLGVSNVSHGMPGRPALNATFLSMALARGLDLPIADPGSEEIRQALVAGNLLLGRDPYGKAYLAGHETLRKGGPQPTLKKAAGAADLAGRIREAVLEGDGEGLTGLVEKALASGWPPLKVSDVGLLPALQEVGRRFKNREFFLPQVVLSSEAVQKAFRRLKAEIGGAGAGTQGRVVMATVKGDIHEIGKNIVCTLLENNGFEVTDLGMDVDAPAIVDAAVAHDADVVGLSALMTTTMVEMPAIIRALREAGCRARTMVGGAVLNREYARKVGADGWAPDAMGAVDEAKRLVALARGKTSS